MVGGAVAIIYADDRVVLVDPNRLAEMVMDTGLIDWLLKKAG